MRTLIRHSYSLTISSIDLRPKEDDGGTWMCWSGFAGNNATLERHFPTVELTPGKPWSCAYRIHATQGLPSLGVVSDSLIASAALPDLHLSACRAIGALFPLLRQA